MVDVTKILCGENGIFTQIKDAQDAIVETVMQGKNLINAVETTITEIETFIDAIQNAPEVVESLLQQIALDIISKQALANPEGALAQILNLRAAYQEAGPAVERIIDNLEAFIKDPLNTPLDVCNDIPNLVKIGETFIEFPKKALQPDALKLPDDITVTLVKEFEEIFDNAATYSEEKLNSLSEQVIKTVSKFPLPDIGNDMIIAGRVPVSQATTLGPGSAQAAAAVHAAKSATAFAVASPGLSPAAIIETNKSTIPPVSLANPFPEGRQFIAQDFAPSKYARNIASKVNTLNSSVRGKFAAGLQDYIKTNFPNRDINVTEGYRSPARSAQLAASGIKAVSAGKSWHNYGAAMDVAIYVNGKYDDGGKGAQEYTGLARVSMQKYGLINDLSGDSGHFYVSAFGKGVPKAIQSGQTSIAAYAASKGFSTVNPTTPTTAQANVTSEGNTTKIDIRTTQRAARDKAMADARAAGKSEREAERLGEIAGNRAGADALRALS